MPKKIVNQEINSIQILKKDASSFVEFTTGDNGVAILPYATSVKEGETESLNYLQPGEYELVETDAPEGYFKAKDLTFSIKDGWKASRSA